MAAERGRSVLGGLARYYRCYECADGAFMAVGAIEPQFYEEFLAILGVDGSGLPDRGDPANWPALSALFAERLRTKTRSDWTVQFNGSDACTVPVLSIGEAHSHPHNAARGVFIGVNGKTQPTAAPRFSRTPGRFKALSRSRAQAGANDCANGASIWRRHESERSATTMSHRFSEVTS